MNNYNSIEKILHRQFLGNNALSNMLYERLLTKSSKINTLKSSANHIFITGLARSGTTAILNRIYSTGEFSSLIYKYMPFILSSTLSNFYSSNINYNDLITKERPHKDGIFINLNSPECLDEVFWIKSNNHKLEENFIKVKEIQLNILNAYSVLLDSFSKIKNNKPMLIKNNNNHIRLKSLSDYFHKAHFIVVFREPISHAKSLLSQHLNFLNLQSKDPFILEYMNLIGHREFGKNSAPFLYDKDYDNLVINKDKKNLEYWLIQWINTYQWILDNNFYSKENIYLISYENLCTNKSIYTNLCNHLSIRNIDSGIKFISANNNTIDSNLTCKSSIKDIANTIYKELQKKSFK